MEAQVEVERLERLKNKKVSSVFFLQTGKTFNSRLQYTMYGEL